MRKAFILLASITTVMVACSDSESSGSAKKDSAAAKTTTPATTDSSTVQKGLALVAKSGCFGCHHVSEKLTGPSYMQVAARYPNNQQVIDSLSQKIVKGGSGNWGTIPMFANPHVSEADAKTMVEYILSLKQ